MQKRPLIVGLRVVTTSLLGVYTGTGSEVVGGPVRRSNSSTEGALVVVVVVVVPRRTPYGLNKARKRFFKRGKDKKHAMIA